MKIELHPVQTPGRRVGGQALAPQVVTMKAYAVYCAVYGPQEAMVTGGGVVAGSVPAK